jgi:hypothetical protein
MKYFVVSACVKACRASALGERQFHGNLHADATRAPGRNFWRVFRAEAARGDATPLTVRSG